MPPLFHNSTPIQILYKKVLSNVRFFTENGVSLSKRSGCPYYWLMVNYQNLLQFTGLFLTEQTMMLVVIILQ